MESFAKISRGWKPFTFFAKYYILDAWVSSENVSDVKFTTAHTQETHENSPYENELLF